MGEDKKTQSYVFVMDKVYGWRPAVQVGTEKGGKVAVSIPEYKDEKSMTCDGGRAAKKGEQKMINLKDYAHGVLPLQNVDANGNLIEFADMVKLPYLHEVRICDLPYDHRKCHQDHSVLMPSIIFSSFTGSYSLQS